MTVSSDMYGRLDRKNIPPPLSMPSFSNYSSMQSMGLNSSPMNNINSPMTMNSPMGMNSSPMTMSAPSMNSVPKSAPPMTSSSDFIQYHLHMLQMQDKSLNSPSALPTPTLPPMMPLTPQMSGVQNPMSFQSSNSPLILTDQADGKNNASRYKTELCRPFEESGTCKYGDKCQFAHGIHELRNLSRHPKYKTELCRTFHTIGFCPYGPRCHFIHNTEEKRAPPISPGPHNSGSNSSFQNIPALLSLLQQSNVSKIMTFLSKWQMQLGANSTDEVLQYLNFNATNIMTPPSTGSAVPGNVNIFSFPEYLNMVPSGSLHQAMRSTSNIHNYFNFNIALKDQHLNSLMTGAMGPGSTPQQPQQQGSFSPQSMPQPSSYHLGTPSASPATSPPLSSPMSDRSSDSYPFYKGGEMNTRMPLTPNVQFEGPKFEDYNRSNGGYHGNNNSSYHGNMMKRSMSEGQGERYVQYTHPNNAKARLPIFNQLSEPVC